MATIYKRGKIWWLAYNIGGKRVQQSIGCCPKKIAEIAKSDIEVKLAKNRAGFFTEDRKLSDCFPEFLSHVAVHTKATTTRRYTQIIGHFQKFLQEEDPPPVNLSQIQPKMIETYKLHRLNFVKPQTVNYEIARIHRFFNYALELGYIQENPTEKIKKIKRPPRKAPRFLSKEEIGSLLKECKPNLAQIIRVLLNTGMRWGELQNLEWEDINWKKKQIQIRIKKYWSPKGGERKVPMNDTVQRTLKNLPRLNGWVFTTKTGSQVRHSHTWARVKTACKKAGLVDVSIHTFRHTFASHLASRGVSLYLIQKLVGHRSIKTTEIYAHVFPDNLAAVVSRLEL